MTTYTPRYNGLWERFGTPVYFAPEVIAEAYGPQVDTWAVGVILFTLLAGSRPFDGSNLRELYDEINASEQILKM